DERIEIGLTAWRMPGGIAGGSACVHCHAPDGIDLAFQNYSDFTLRRRGSEDVSPGLETLSANKLEDIVNMIRALQAKYDLTPVNPKENIPFQPGGFVLKAASNEHADYLFGKSLKEHGLRVVTIPIKEEEEAKRQLEEWKALSIEEMPIGIELNHWSEDPYNSSSVRVLADWLPPVPMKPAKKDEEKWLMYQMLYQHNPGYKTLADLLKFVDETGIPFQNGRLAELSKLKYRALLIAQHHFRENAMKIHSEQHSLNLTLKKVEEFYPNVNNPFWQIGEFFNRNPSIYTTDLPANMNGRFSDAGSTNLSLPWFWLGWLADPTFELTYCNTPEYCIIRLAETLADEQLYFHRLYFLLKTKAMLLNTKNKNLSTRILFDMQMPPYENPEAEYLYGLILDNSKKMFYYLKNL
ncbi:MAG: hypothetical protein JJU37_07285, partial [Balneolaceae bacterium]|nr:hypothetical protein [Balneolaceae bacterium]